MGKQIKTDFLVGTPSLATGVARMLDFYGQFDSYNGSESESEADYRAMLSDWNNVGCDIGEVLDQEELATA